MAGREMHANQAAAYQQKTVRPVLIGRFDILSDPVIAWTGPGTFMPVGTGDAAMDGQVFEPLAPIVDISPIDEDMGIGGPVVVTLTGHDLDQDILRQVIRDKRQWRGRKAWIWEGLIDVDEHSVIQNPVRLKTGFMTQIRTRRDKDTAEVMVTVDRDLGNARSAPYRWVDHAQRYSGDTFSNYIVKLANKPRGLESSDIKRQGSSGAGGGAASGGYGPMRPF